MRSRAGDQLTRGDRPREARATCTCSERWHRPARRAPRGQGSARASTSAAPSARAPARSCCPTRCRGGPFSQSAWRGRRSRSCVFAEEVHRVARVEPVSAERVGRPVARPDRASRGASACRTGKSRGLVVHRTARPTPMRAPLASPRLFGALAAPRTVALGPRQPRSPGGAPRPRRHVIADVPRALQSSDPIPSAVRFGARDLTERTVRVCCGERRRATQPQARTKAAGPRLTVRALHPEFAT